MTRYKCLDCFVGYMDEADCTNGCPECGSTNLEKHCEKDNPCHCGKHMHEHVVVCDVCGQPVCPTCNCHDVVAISRITGYLSDLSGWSMGKRQEFIDRKRYGIGTEEE